MKYRIKLADGTELKNLALNGNNYISTEKGIESALTPVNLTNVTISDGTAEECFENMVLTNTWEQQDGTHFILREMTLEEKAAMDVDAKIEYIAMMADIDL